MIFELLSNGEPSITIEGLNIPEFKKIWMNDKTKDKIKAKGEIAYIYHMVSPKSSYASLSSDDKEKMIKNDYLKNIKDWQPSQLVLEGLTKYAKLINTPSLRLLESAINTADELAKYFNSITFEQLDTDTSGKVISNMGKLPAVVKALNDLRESVKKEQEMSNEKIRGGNTFSILEDEY